MVGLTPEIEKILCPFEDEKSAKSSFVILNFHLPSNTVTKKYPYLIAVQK
jgi:hypothetical protein